MRIKELAAKSAAASRRISDLQAQHKAIYEAAASRIKTLTDKCEAAAIKIEELSGDNLQLNEMIAAPISKIVWPALSRKANSLLARLRRRKK
jgi:hypothetical protein